jgi:putative nucleotidyltransferase with HDIG domain
MSSRRPIFTTRLSRARDAAARTFARPFNWLRPTTQFVIAFAVLSIVTTFLLSHTHSQAPMEMYREGDVVRTSVIAPADIGYEDPQLTSVARTNDPSTAPVTGFVKRNQVVAHEGDTVTARMLAQMDAIRGYSHHERRPEHYLGLLFLVAALYWGVWKFIEHRDLDKALILSKGKTYTLLTSAILIETLLMRVGVIVAKSIAAQNERAPWNDATILSFAIPFAAATLLVALLTDAQLALIAAMVTAIFAGILAPNGIMMACYAMISSSAAIFGVGRYRERQSVTLAGVYVAVVNSLTAVAVIFAAQQPLTVGALLLAFGAGLAGGMLTTIFTAGGLPVNESLFGVLTDVKLLELSNADLPVLGQLALRAPGTNQHSHAVGQLAEDACRAIGANTLLARIGALYHDIGKLAAPDMFIENQAGDNPHDRLRPSNSARIITSHVTYGMRLAKEIGLPQKIADFIPQHHGTRTLHYFLRKAQAQAIHGEQVTEADFRYPGPKPQFKEAAIMMLADSCEAAARSLARPDPQNIRSICNKIFEAIVSDGQLDECDLSLRELTAIRESIIASLTAIYHARIDYPGFNPPALSTSMAAALPAADLDTEERGIHYNKPSEVPISKGGEVEDEAVTSKGRQ